MAVLKLKVQRVAEVKSQLPWCCRTSTHIDEVVGTQNGEKQSITCTQTEQNVHFII